MSEVSVLVGRSAPAVLRSISDQLKRRTLDQSQVRGLQYTPWLCSFPVLDPGRIPQILLETPYMRGRAVSDRQYLGSIAKVMRAEPALILDQLIGNPEDWNIHCDVAVTRPMMIVELDDISDHVRGISTFFDDVFDAVVEMVVPLHQPRARGLSSQLMRGVIFLGYAPGYSSIDLALDLVHEMGHQALALLQSCDPLFVSNPHAPVFSEVRHAARPAVQSLHAAAAISFMLEYVSNADIPNHLHPDFDITLSDALERAVAALHESCRFTDLGEQILLDFERLLNSVHSRVD